MALFKILRGNSNNLPQEKKTDIVILQQTQDYFI